MIFKLPESGNKEKGQNTLCDVSFRIASTAGGSGG